MRNGLEQEANSQRVMFGMVEQHTGQSKVRYFVLYDQHSTPLLHLKRSKEAAQWEGYDSWTQELLFRITPTLEDANNVMSVKFLNAAAVPLVDTPDAPDDPSLEPGPRGVVSLPRLVDFDEDWPSAEERRSGGYDQGMRTTVHLSYWKALHSRDQLNVLTRQCARSDRLNEVVRTF